MQLNLLAGLVALLVAQCHELHDALPGIYQILGLCKRQSADVGQDSVLSDGVVWVELLVNYSVKLKTHAGLAR